MGNLAKFFSVLFISLFLIGASQLSAARPAEAKPAEIDCGVLGVALAETDNFIDTQGGVQFANLGDLITTVKKDQATWDQLNALIGLFSGNTISFDSPEQAISSIAKCGLMPLVIEDIRD